MAAFHARFPIFFTIRSCTGADFCYNKLPFELDLFDLETFAKDPMAFYIGATDVHTGEAVYHRCDRGDRTDMLWLRASASMPLVSRPVIVEGRALLDGGIADSIPYAFMEEQGYNRNIIILTQPEGYRKRPSSPVFCKLLQGKYPAIAQALSVRHDMYNQQLAGVKAREEQGVSLVIRPPEDLGIRRTENRPEELERVYQIGREEGKRRLAEVRQFTA